MHTLSISGLLPAVRRQVTYVLGLRGNRRRSLFVSVVPVGEVVKTFGTWCDGGSRREYDTLSTGGGVRMKPVDVPRDPPQFGGGPPVELQVTEHEHVLVAGMSCGKPAIPHIYTCNPAEVLVEVPEYVP